MRKFGIQHLATTMVLADPARAAADAAGTQSDTGSRRTPGSFDRAAKGAVRGPPVIERNRSPLVVVAIVALLLGEVWAIVGTPKRSALTLSKSDQTVSVKRRKTSAAS